MTHEAATARAAELNLAEEGGRHWFVREVHAGDYEVVAVTAPGLSSRVQLKASVESKPRPGEPPDPRSSLFRNIPPYGAG